MIEVLSSTKYVTDGSTEVEIVKSKIDEFAERVQEKDLRVSEVSLSKLPWSLNTLIQIIFAFNTVNFCYWAAKEKEKWFVEIEGKKLDGAVALFRCLEEEIKRNSDFLEGDELADLTLGHLSRILKGNVTIPLLGKRLECLQEAGRVLEEKFNGNFLNVYKESNNDALKMAELLITNFSSFNDVSGWKGQTIAFYKRAQLNSKMVSDALRSNGQRSLDNLDKLTAFADYKIPQMLRKKEILNYSKSLADKIDNFVEIPEGSQEEIEIRANTIWACEFIKRELKSKFPSATAAHIDSLLWLMSQKKSLEDKPYHRTRTIFY